MKKQDVKYGDTVVDKETGEQCKFICLDPEDLDSCYIQPKIGLPRCVPLNDIEHKNK